LANILACRINKPGWIPIVSEMGLRFVEVYLTNRKTAAPLIEALNRHGLQIVTVHVDFDITSDEGIMTVPETFKYCADLGAKVIFASVKVGDSDYEGACNRLRTVGDQAGEHDLVVALETHPDMATNGDVAGKTMQAVDHPRVRLNFDPANIYFYNQNVDAVTELKKVLPFVASLHLKDTIGAYWVNDFPPIGRGVVDFEEILSLLVSVGFAGPMTFEVEGRRVRNDVDHSLFARHLEESLEFLARLGIRP